MADGRQLDTGISTSRWHPTPSSISNWLGIVRKAAPDGFLWADANGGYDPRNGAPSRSETGRRRESTCSKRQSSRIRYPVIRPSTDKRALPILMDEGIVSPVELAEFIRLKMLDGISMKPARCGGLMSNKRQIEMIQQARPDVARQRTLRPGHLVGRVARPLRCVRINETGSTQRTPIPHRRCPRNTR